MSKAARILAPIAIATLLGPLAAGLTFCLAAIANAIVSEGADASAITDALKMSVVYIVVAYYDGMKIAVLAGILLAVWMVWRRPGLIAANIAAITAVALHRFAAEIGMLGGADFSALRNNLVLYMVLSVIAATTCWAVTLPWARRL